MAYFRVANAGIRYATNAMRHAATKAYRDLGVLIACSTLQSPFIDEMKAAVEQWIMAGQRNTAEMQGAIGRGVLARRRPVPDELGRAW